MAEVVAVPPGDRINVALVLELDVEAGDTYQFHAVKLAGGAEYTLHAVAIQARSVIGNAEIVKTDPAAYVVEHLDSGGALLGELPIEVSVPLRLPGGEPSAVALIFEDVHKPNAVLGDHQLGRAPKAEGTFPPRRLV